MFDYIYIDDWKVPGVRSLTGLGSPVPRQDVTVRAARDGAIDRTLYYQGRVLSLQGVIWGVTEFDAWASFDSLKGKLALGSTHVLRFRRTGFLEDEQLDVIVASPVDDGTSYDAPNSILYGVSLHAADPRIYTSALRTDSYDPAVSQAGGGIAVPLSFPLVFTFNEAGLLEVSNAGNFKSPPVLTIQGPVVNPILDNVTTGESIELSYSLGADDVVEIDVAARSVTLNGASRPDLLVPQATTWWELAPGTNQIRLRGTGMTVKVEIEGTTNLIPNGGFETNTSGWALGGGVSTFAQVSGSAAFGSKFARIDVTGASPTISVTPSPVVVSGEPYTLSAYLMSGQAAGKSAGVQINDGGVLYRATIPLAAGWQRVEVTCVPTSGTVGIAVGGFLGGFVSGDHIYVDGVQFEQNDHATDYLDTNGAPATRVGQVLQTATQLSVAYRDARI